MPHMRRQDACSQIVTDVVRGGSKQRAACVVAGPVGCGKATLCIRSLEQSVFVPIVHRCTRVSESLQVLCGRAGVRGFAAAGLWCGRAFGGGPPGPRAPFDDSVPRGRGGTHHPPTLSRPPPPPVKQGQSGGSVGTTSQGKGVQGGEDRPGREREGTGG